MAKMIRYFFLHLRLEYEMEVLIQTSIIFLDDKYARILTSVPISNKMYGKNKDPNIAYKLLAGNSKYGF